MILKHFNIKTPTVKAPAEDNWEQLPLGYYRMSKCTSPDRKAYDEKVIKKIREAGNMVGGDFQQDCLLSILADIKREEISFFELGAGWGRICLNIAGAIDFEVIQCTPKRYRCLAIEAEPVHYEWLKEHFKAQNINSVTVFGALSNKKGTCHFNARSRPDYEYGQSIVTSTNRRGIPSVQNIKMIITGKTIKVPKYTIDQLVKEYGFDRVDIVQMDVQGTEYDAMRGAADSIKEGKIDYFLINIHLNEYSNALPALLVEKYNLILDLKRASVGVVTGFPPIQCTDGIQLYKRKGI